jgi:integrase
MNTTPEQIPSGQQKRTAYRPSKDGKWRSFSRVPHLLQYSSSGTYFARIKVGGKIIRESLETDVWSIAQLRLVDFLKAKLRDNQPDEKQNVSFGEAARLYRKRVEDDPAMKTRSKGYRFLCMKKIEATWPGLAKKFLREITEQDCREWAAALQNELASQYFNNVVGTLRLIFAEGIKEQTKRGGAKLDNPTNGLSRARISQRALKLPERDQFKALVSKIAARSSWGPKAANLVEFLAYSGTRLYTEAQWVMWEDIDWKRMEIIVRGYPETGTKNWEIRRIPIIPDMEELLKRMQADKQGQVTGKLLEIVECPISLEKACLDVGISKLRHHDLRHLFATRCIESGVDIPTVSRWLGHKDGGALAMKTYGHLRNEHSQAMAQKVKF